MRRPRGLVVRVLLVAGLGALLAVPVVIVPLAQWISEGALRRTLGSVPGLVEALAADCAGLAGRIAGSHRNIVAATDALDAHATALEQHLADVAHDVRTPLSSLQLRLESLIEHGAGAEAADDRVLAALDDVLYLSSLTENLRLGNRLSDPAERDVIEVELGPIVRRVVDRFSALGALRSVVVRGSWPDTPVAVRCDPAAVEQALTNLRPLRLEPRLRSARSERPAGGDPRAPGRLADGYDE